MEPLGSASFTLDFLAGAITLGYLAASLFFIRFWRNTGDRLFIAFGVAFAAGWLIAKLGRGSDR